MHCKAFDCLPISSGFECECWFVFYANVFLQLLCCCFSVQFIIIIIAIDCSLVSLPSSSFSQRSISSTFTRMDSIRAANETLNSVDVHKAPVKGTERKSYKTHIDGVCLCVRYAYVAVHDDVCLLLLNWCSALLCRVSRTCLTFGFELVCLRHVGCGHILFRMRYKHTQINTRTHIELSSWARSRSFDYLFLSRLFHCIRLAVCFVLLWCCWFVVCVFFLFLCIPCASLLSVGIFHCWLLRLFLNAFGRVQPVWFTNPNESFVDLLFIYITHKVELYGLKMKKETLAHTHKQQYITQSVSAIVGSGGNVRSKSPCVIVIIFLYTQTNIRSYLCFWLL